MPPTRSLATGFRRAALVTVFVASSMDLARVEATTIVSVSGTSTTGWTFTNTSGNSSQNGNLTSSVTGLSGTWWGLYANAGQTASQTYSFASALQSALGSSVLPVGGSVQIDLALGFIQTNATVGISLQNAAGDNRFETYYIGASGTDTFYLNDAGGQESVAGVDTSFNASSWKPNPAQFQTLLFTQGPSNTYTLAFDGTNVTNTGLTINASDISQIRFFNANAGSGGDFNQYANNLQVVPEPPAILTIVGGLAGMVVYRLNRRRFN